MEDKLSQFQQDYLDLTMKYTKVQEKCTKVQENHDKLKWFEENYDVVCAKYMELKDTYENSANVLKR